MRKHPFLPLVTVALLVLVAAAPPPRPAGGNRGPKKPVTITGEILDMGCYISRSLRGDIHRECALKCLMSGVPIGLLGPDSTVYILTQNHDRAMDPRAYGPPDPFEICRQSPAKQLAVTGLLWERYGYKELEVKAAMPASQPPSAP